MPYVQLKEIWTPLTFFGIHLYRDPEEHGYYYRIGSHRIRKFKDKEIQSN